MIRILIVDDEPSASNVLLMLIEEYIPGVKEIKICNAPEEALSLIPVYKPTLLMLDIEMPHMNGFDLLNRIGHWNFDIIFTTAYDKYAIKAIRFSALDYLLKPIDVLDLQNAVNRHLIKKEFKPQQQDELINNLISNLQKKDSATFKLALNTMEGVFFFNPADIIRCEGVNNYTHFYLCNHKPVIVSKTLKEYEEILLDYNFIRVHKSHLVNKFYIKHLDKEGLLWLTDDNHIVVSRRRKDEVIKELTQK